MPCSSTRCHGRPPYVLFPLTAGLPLMGSHSCCANSPSGLRETPHLMPVEQGLPWHPVAGTPPPVSSEQSSKITVRTEVFVGHEGGGGGAFLALPPSHTPASPVLTPSAPPQKHFVGRRDTEDNALGTARQHSAHLPSSSRPC